MPVHQCHTVQQGTAGHTLFVFAIDDDTRPAAYVDLTALQVAYVRTAQPPVAVSMAPTDVRPLGPGQIAEVDADLLPGVYEVGLPDAMLAEGATEAVLSIHAPGVRFDPVKFNLVAYDPQDAWSLGMTQLQDYKRHQVLRQALPRFTEMELALGKDNEQRLADHLGEEPPAWAKGGGA